MKEGRKEGRALREGRKEGRKEGLYAGKSGPEAGRCHIPPAARSVPLPSPHALAPPPSPLPPDHGGV